MIQKAFFRKDYQPRFSALEAPGLVTVMNLKDHTELLKTLASPKGTGK